MDEVQLATARESAVAQGYANVDFRLMYVYDWDKPATYDLVYCRFLLQHLGRPGDVQPAVQGRGGADGDRDR